MEIFAIAWLGKPVWMWAAFLSLVLLLLAFDLGILHKKNRELGISESLRLSVFYVVVALAYGGAVWWAYEQGHIVTEDGVHAGVAFFTGYFLEKSLSIDNVFVISLIFTYFAIPRRFQYRALLWGILAVIVLRGIMIGVGAALVKEYDWILFIFGAFLIFTGVKMLLGADAEPEIGSNPVLRFMKRHMRVSDRMHGERFFVHEPHPRTGEMVLWATPLFLALAVINVADLVFAVDSVPAIFAITTDTFVVYTANIMAILGLRALYFALSAMVHRFHYLKYALSIVLVFIGVKIFWNHFVGKMDPSFSLGVIVVLIGGGVLYSMWKTRSEAREAEAHGAE